MENKKRIYKHRPYESVATLSKVTQEQKDKVIDLYKQGLAQSSIERDLCMTRKTIRTILKEAGIDRSKSQQWQIRHGSVLDETVFDILTPDACYWLGFLHADGHIAKNRGYSIELVQHQDDTPHLEKFIRFLKSSIKVTKAQGNCNRVRIGSEIIHKRLQELGFKHDKSYSAKPHELLKHSRDFWRGCIDGDGGVYNYVATPQVFLCGTLETIFDFIIFCSKEIGIREKYPSKATGKDLHQVQYYGEDAIRIVHFIYSDTTLSLDRKYQKYLEIIGDLVMSD